MARKTAIPRIEEDLNVGKRLVNRVVLRSEDIEVTRDGELQRPA